jgi:hypothetical protein
MATAAGFLLAVPCKFVIKLAWDMPTLLLPIDWT